MGEIMHQEAIGMSTTGNISINAQNIMPIIKRWLYSDKDIFLREIVSNGCDAIAKYKLLALKGETAAEEAPRVDVVLNASEGTLKIIDNGIGMTDEEVKRYIAQVAFSGAEEFLKMYKTDEQDGGIIGHFGLGFYSAFMVSSKVVIDTLSWQPDAQPVRWISEDGMKYSMEPSERTARGTTITLTIAEEDREFLQMHKLRETLDRYCAFMPVPIFLSEDKPAEDAPCECKHDHTEGDSCECKHDHAEGDSCECKQDSEKPVEKPVNDVSPLWNKRPAEVTDEEYKAFYHKVFHDYEDPLFWIHLNAEYPFNLKGILYFPRLKNEFTANEGVIKLYNKQVFVADNIKEVIPEFLMLLKGAIDCPDLPLNVSRSFLQNDGYVRKMSAYITRKVADRLISEFTGKREDYEKYWNDIHPFVKYGCIRDEKFYDRVKDAILFKTTDDRHLTLAEYRDKNFEGDNKTVFYTSDEKRQAQMVQLYTTAGKDVVQLGTLIDSNFISFLEAKDKDGLKFQRVDGGMDGLTDEGGSDEMRQKLETLFREGLSQKDLPVELKSFKTDELPAMITVDEQSRRFSEMSKAFGGYAVPERPTLVLNARHPLIGFLQTAPEGDLTTMIVKQVMDLAEMARSPLESERMVAFLKRSSELLTLAAKERGDA
jgi:molecular chaperone HtpG